MPFKSATQPFCRWCAKPIRKHIRTVWLEAPKADITRRTDISDFERTLYVEPLPSTKAECQRHTNGRVVSVQRNYEGTKIRRFGEWDGESYVDEFFCIGEHARAYAYATARNGLATPAYFEAFKKQQKESKS